MQPIDNEKRDVRLRRAACLTRYGCCMTVTIRALAALLASCLLATAVDCRKRLSVSALVLAILLGASSLPRAWIAVAATKVTSQTFSYADLPKTFEVAAIRPGNPHDRNKGFWIRPGRFWAENFPLDRLILYAYQIRPEQLSDLPSWAKSRLYTIQAETPPSTPKLTSSLRQRMFRQMLRSLLADRFGLKAHWTIKRLPAYELIVAKGGSKLKPVNTADFIAAHRKPEESWWFDVMDGKMTALDVSVGMLADFLSNRLNETVLDRTGLTGHYDFKVIWDPRADRLDATDISAKSAVPQGSKFTGPSLLMAIHQQLGLRLKSGKGPVQVLVIDHIEPPTPN